LLEIASLEEFGYPGYKLRHQLAIIGVEVYKQNGREMSSVSNNRIGGSRSQDRKTHMFNRIQFSFRRSKKTRMGC
jgi:hypothetical protein